MTKQDPILLKVCDSKAESEKELHIFAGHLKDMSITDVFGVYISPMQKHWPSGTWGVWMQRR